MFGWKETCGWCPRAGKTEGLKNVKLPHTCNGKRGLVKTAAPQNEGSESFAKAKTDSDEKKRRRSRERCSYRKSQAGPYCHDVAIFRISAVQAAFYLPNYAPRAFFPAVELDCRVSCDETAERSVVLMSSFKQIYTW